MSATVRKYYKRDGQTNIDVPGLQRPSLRRYCGGKAHILQRSEPYEGCDGLATVSASALARLAGQSPFNFATCVVFLGRRFEANFARIATITDHLRSTASRLGANNITTEADRLRSAVMSDADLLSILHITRALTKECQQLQQGTALPVT